ncbi:hypothetical protein Tco_1202953 [Tanacetum coccineum]
MRSTLMRILVFTLCEEQVEWNSVLMRLIDDLLALDLIVHFGFSDQRLERTAAFSISTNSENPDESLFRAWERFKELLMKFPQHYLTDMQEVVLFYNGLDVPTRQILDSKGAIPSKAVADAKITIQEMAE